MDSQIPKPRTLSPKAMWASGSLGPFETPLRAQGQLGLWGSGVEVWGSEAALSFLMVPPKEFTDRLVVLL